MSNSVEEITGKKYKFHTSTSFNFGLSEFRHIWIVGNEAKNTSQIAFTDPKCAQELLQILLNEVNEFISRSEKQNEQ